MKNYGTFKADKAATDDFVTARDKKNSEGYNDSVPYFVMKNDAEYVRFRRFIDLIFKAAQLCGFYITGKIEVSDNYTGKNFRWVFKPRQ